MATLTTGCASVGEPPPGAPVHQVAGGFRNLNPAFARPPFWPRTGWVQALQVAADFAATHLAAMHWGAFDLTDEPFDEPPRRLRDEAARRGSARVGAGVRLSLLVISTAPTWRDRSEMSRSESLAPNAGGAPPAG